jgi:hypothetical protein
MPDVCDIYSKGIKKKLKNYWAAWLPTTKFELGDIGILNGHYFQKVSSLASLEIPFDTTADGSPSPIELVSTSGVSIKVKIAGETNEAFASVPKGSAGLKIDFGSEGAFVVQCPATFEPAISDPLKLQNKIIDLFEKGQWQADWVVIVRLVTAPSATILISNSTAAGLELSSTVEFSAGLADLGSAGLGLSLKSQTGDIFKMLGAQGVTPFFQVATLKRRLFGAPRFTTKSMFGLDHSIKSTITSQAEDLYLDVLRDEEVGAMLHE